MALTLGIILVLVLAFVLGPRPRLNPTPGASRVPTDLPPAALGDWLEAAEATIPELTPGAEATIDWADPENPGKTDLVFVYLHGFSATRQETAPVTENIAATFDANIVHVRLAGHGVGPDGMATPSEDWLQSTLDTFNIASQVGDRIVLVGTSTGVTLATWLLFQPGINTERVVALLAMSPNFKIRNPFGFLLTWPWAYHWVPMLLGRSRSWEPENEMAAKYWTHSYDTVAVIEMQKVVDHVATLRLEDANVPMAMMYMTNDPTVDTPANLTAFDRWGAPGKELIQVTIDPDEESHVFVGNITAPHRVDWCVDMFTTFLEPLVGDTGTS